IHPELEKIILTALEKWPAQRQQSSAELRDALNAILPELSEERKPLAEGKQPPAPEIQVEDRAPASDDLDLAATLPKDERAHPPAVVITAPKAPPPAPPKTLPPVPPPKAPAHPTPPSPGALRPGAIGPRGAPRPPSVEIAPQAAPTAGQRP